MKKLIVIMSMFVSLVCAQAQTSDTYASQFKKTTMDIVDHLTTASNYNVHVEAVYNDAIKKVGIKEGIDYLIAPGVYSTLSVLEFDGSAFGMTGTFALQKQWAFFKGNLQVATAVKAGAVTCLSGKTFGSITIPGKQVNSGDFGGVVGSDLCFAVPQWKYAPDLLLGYEKLSIVKGNFFSVGFHWSLGSIL